VNIQLDIRQDFSSIKDPYLRFLIKVCSLFWSKNTQWINYVPHSDWLSALANTLVQFLYKSLLFNISISGDLTVDLCAYVNCLSSLYKIFSIIVIFVSTFRAFNYGSW